MIAYEYANIPGAGMDEIIAEAEGALAAAGRAFDPEKGQFTAYAGRAIRNALNSLFTRQLRYVKVHEFSLDAEPTTSDSTSLGSRPIAVTSPSIATVRAMRPTSMRLAT